jgi:hypothetical protein
MKLHARSKKFSVDFENKNDASRQFPCGNLPAFFSRTFPELWSASPVRYNRLRCQFNHEMMSPHFKNDVNTPTLETGVCSANAWFFHIATSSTSRAVLYSPVHDLGTPLFPPLRWNSRNFGAKDDIDYK